MDKRAIINTVSQIIIYYVVWLVCISMAAKQNIWLGAYISFFLVLLQVVIHQVTHKRLGVLLIFSSSLALIGLCVDSIMIFKGVFIFNAMRPEVSFAPPFLWGIWLSFSIMFYSILSAWFKRYALISILSALGFPLSYWVGSLMGAAQAPQGEVSYIILGSIWAVLLPLFLYLYNRVTDYVC